MQHQLIDAQHLFHPAAFDNKQYTLLSIVGSQSSGKSTLLNEMFQLQFDVMQSSRKQTTRGVVLDSFKNDVQQVIVCDVEGSDGREHGDEQKTERLLLLFALSVSDILLFNLFENAVGLYHGANMGLMRMCLEIYYEIFIEKHLDEPIRKKTLLFVVRDYTSTTPVEEMRAILYHDISKIWEELTDRHVDLYFDVNIHALPHYKLQKSEFTTSVKALKSNVLSLEFKDALRVHTDSLNEYMSRVWDLISKNKELDVPTQMELVMKYRVERLGQECVEALKNDLLQKNKPEFTITDPSATTDIQLITFRDYISEVDALANQHFKTFKSNTKRVSIDVSDVYTTIANELHVILLQHLELSSSLFKQLVDNIDQSNELVALLQSIKQIKDYYTALIPSELMILKQDEVVAAFNTLLIKSANASHLQLLDQLEINKDWRSAILKASNIHDAYIQQLQQTWVLYQQSEATGKHFY